MRDYSKLKALLDEQETFPLSFPVKFIGKNTDAFTDSVAEFEAEYADLCCESRRLSSGGNHLALSYVFLAPDSNSVIALLERISEIDDIQVIL